MNYIGPSLIITILNEKVLDFTKMRLSMMVLDKLFLDVNRVEVIDNNGRSYTKNRVGEVKVQLQDDMRTLKLFVQFEEDEEISID